AGFGTDGVSLAKHLLGQELQFSARTFRFVQHELELVKVAGQPHHFFGNVTSLGENRDLPDKVSTVNFHVQFGQQALDPLQQAVPKQLRNLRAANADVVQMASDGVAVGQ